MTQKLVLKLGVITADNGDGTYAVKIAQADKAYPYVETAFPDMVFGVSEVVLVTFEYGNKEMPRILGYAKRIAQHPIDDETDYSGTEIIDIGDAAIDRNSYVGVTGTKVNRNNPANADGKITSIEIYAVEQMPDAKVATFYLVSQESGTIFYLSTRDYVTLGTVAAGSKQTFTRDAYNNDISMTVHEGDYIGICGGGGQIEKSTELTGLKFLTWTGNQIPCTNQQFNISGDFGNISLYGKGLT
ncbi:hypothetical protein ES705_49905 [subsurface metagenome]